VTRDTFHDLETRSPVPIKSGPHTYAEQAEVLLWAFAVDDDFVHVWDRLYNDLWTYDVMGESWAQQAVPDGLPPPLAAVVRDPEALVWFQNGGMFDMVVLQHDMPDVYRQVEFTRWRDTMVQAFAHGLPGALDKLGAVLRLEEDQRKIKRGRDLIRVFCIPNNKSTPEEPKYNDRSTHPDEWVEFIQYAAGDIITMMAAHRKMPKWNYGGPSEVAQFELTTWLNDLRINYRGVCMDLELARHAVRAVETEKRRLAARTVEVTEGALESTTQRDATLAYLLGAYGVELPDMQADTLERRMQDPELPEPVRELLALRLQASQNAASKYKTLMRSVSSDGRLRGTKQYCGAGRTGRWAGRLMQMDNMPRPNIPAIAAWCGVPKAQVKSKHIQRYLDYGIQALVSESEDLLFDTIMPLAGTAVRGTLVAAPGKKLVIADLANIEGRVAAWLAGETWKIQAFLDYDTIVMFDEEGEPIRKGPDLYRKSYAKSFNVTIEEVTKENRQVGKVQELMLQYQGGVGAFITGAATYELDLNVLADAAWPVLPADVVEEARSFMQWLYSDAEEKAAKAAVKANVKHALDSDPEALTAALAEIDKKLEAAKLKARLGLTEKAFLVCDSLKRLWRAAHPAISSYWKGTEENPGIEDSVRAAIGTPGITFRARKLSFRCDGVWLRIRLPSGRVLCYPDPQVDADGKISYVGLDSYTRKWGRVKTYGGKLFENVCQAVARDQLALGINLAEDNGYEVVLHVHDEIVAEVDDNDLFSHDELAQIMCARRPWNEGLPLAAAGFTTKRYRKD
jgi:DNA polymerase bacteriophage-type